MKLSFFGGAKTVTGSSYFLETNGLKILIDCGLFQGSFSLEKKNFEPFPFSVKDLDYVLITHAHIDHIGRLPKLVNQGFQGKILATPPTVDFVEPMLLDSQGLLEKETERHNLELLYTREDVKKCVGYFEKAEYDQKIKLGKGVECIFREAGHILGSAVIELNSQSQKEDKKIKIVFSGDLGNPPVPLLRRPAVIHSADYMVVESAYGNRIHEGREERQNLLEDVIESTISQKGVLLIPSFALERTQELLYTLNLLIENARIPHVPIFIDSPLAIKLTEIYRRYSKYFNQEASYLINSGDDLFKFRGLKVCRTVEESKSINNVNPPKVIIAGAGMSTGGRILHHELRYLPKSKTTFLIICYQAKGTLGRKIFQGAKKVKILGQEIPVRAKIKAIGGYSAHADQIQLFNWVKNSHRSLKKVFIVQGEEESSMALRQIIRDHLGIEAEVPAPNETVELN